MPSDMSGLRVIDFSRVLAGPYAGQILAGLGAEVIKVELPAGDPAREVGPFLGNRSLYFSAVNSGKSGVCVDPAVPSDMDFLNELIASADVLLHNFREESAESLGLDRVRLRSHYPHLVIVSLTGYAKASDAGERGAYDLTIQAESGHMSVTGEIGGAPMRAGVPVSDLTAGLWATIAVTSGLLSRSRTGVGNFTEVPLLDSSLSLLSYMATAALGTGVDPEPVGSGHHSVVPYRAYATRDGYIVIAALSAKFWPGVCRALGLRDLEERDDLLGTSARRNSRAEIDARIEEACAQLTSSDALARLTHSGVPAARVNSVLEALETDYVRDRGLVESVVAPEGAYGIIRGPFDSPRSLGAAPSLGQDGARLRQQLRDSRAVDK